MKKHSIYINFIMLISFLLGAAVILSAQSIKNPSIFGPNKVKVNSYTGNLFYERSDLNINGLGIGLSTKVRFYYNSARAGADQGYGFGWTFEYHMQYQLDSLNNVILERKDGRKDLFLRSNGDLMAPIGVFDKLEEFEAGKYRLTDKFGKAYYFEDAGHKKLSRIEDLNGNQLILSYTDSQLTTITNPSGRSLSLGWLAGHLVAIKDNSSPVRSIALEYEDGQLLAVTNPLGDKELYTYDDRNKLIQLTDRNGNPLIIEYSKSDRVKKLISCISEQKFTYHNDKTYLVEKGNAGTLSTIYAFDTLGQVIQITNPAHHSLSYEYDEHNNITKRIDCNGHAKAFTYDDRGNMLTATNAMAFNKQFKYTQYSRLSEFTSRGGNTATYDYDPLGNLITIKLPMTNTISVERDGVGHPSVFEDGNGQITTHNYDDNGNLVSAIYPIGTTTYEYDEKGNATLVKNANNHSISMEYDPLDRVIGLIDPLSNKLTLEYDANNNLTSLQDANGIITSKEYDELNRLTAVTIPAGTTSYNYDPIGNLTGILDANGNETRFSYNAQNLVTKEITPLGKTTTYSYDKNGNLLQRTDPNGKTTTYTYDALDRLTSRSYAENTDHYSYDRDGNLVNAYNDDINISYTYDALNRLLSKTYNTLGKSIQYTYDDAGNRLTMIDPEGGLTSYIYDGNNRLVRLQNPLDQITVFTYDDVGLLTKRENANGTVTRYIYNEANSLLNVTHETSANEQISAQSYTYDKQGNRKSMTDQNGGLNQYDYDDSYRLTEVNYANSDTESFTYDPMGNRVEHVSNGMTISYDYDKDDQLLSAGNSQYEFDDNGNLIITREEAGTTSYIYDTQNRLTRVNFPDGSFHTYSYDPFGKRISKTEKAGTTTYFLHDEQNVLMEVDELGEVEVRYTSDLTKDGWLSMDRNGQSYIYQEDVLGSIIGLSNFDQELVASYTYSAYGEIIEQLGTIENPFTFTGRAFDAETGLYYFRTRYYDPNLGRFLSKDSFRAYLGLPLSLHRYGYAHGNPTTYIDPDGQAITLVGAILAGAAVLAVVAVVAAVIEYGIPLINKVDETMQRRENMNNPEIDQWERNRLQQEQSELGVEGAELGGQVGIELVPKPGENDVSEAIYEHIVEPLLPYIEPYFEEDEINPGEREEEEEDPDGSEEDPDEEASNRPDGEEFEILVLHAVDPNDITGEIGFEEPQWVSIQDELGYTIRFENDPEFATAPAQVVKITHPIDTNLNLFSFRLGDFGFGDFIFQPPANASFYVDRLDVRDSLGIFVDITAGIDVTKQEVFWIFESIDPETGLAPSDALLGFLPVNDTTVTIYNDTITQQGEGFVSFIIKPDKESITGDSIQASASIVFDINAPIPTNTWENLIDAFPPNTTVGPLPDTMANSSFELSWSGTDDPGGVGIAYYDLFVSKNGEAFYLYQAEIDTNFILFKGEAGSSYSFYTRATDQVGNREAEKNTGDTKTIIKAGQFLDVVSPALGASFCSNDTLLIDWISNASTISLAISTDGGLTFKPIAESLNASNQPYYWPIPDTLSGVNMVIRIQDDEIPEVLDLSSAFSIYQQPEAIVEAIDSVSCFGNSDGQAVVMVSNGTPAYSFQWDNGETASTAVALNTGVHTVTVTDSRQCQATAEVFIDGTQVISALVSTTPDTMSTATGSATVVPDGGTPPYSFSWSTDPPQDSSTAIGLSAGDYFVTITDAQGCTLEQMLSVDLITAASAPETITDIRVFPNPTTARVTIDVSLARPIDMELVLYNVLGQSLQHITRSKANSCLFELDLSDYQAGVFCLMLRVENEEVMTKLVLIK